MAAYVNGAMAHALNYDDATPAGAHLGASTLAAALAAAEHQGGVTGRALLEALAAGAEVTARLGAAVTGTPYASEMTRAPRPLRIQIWSYFGATAAAGRILGLSPRQMHSALGMALMQAAGSYQPVLEGRPAKIYTGFPSLGGALAALLARQGVQQECALLEGEAGLFAMYYDRHFDRSALVDELGERFHLLAVRFKPWPTTGVAHPFIEAALDLAGRHALTPAAIDRVLIRGGPRARHHCEPVVERRRPDSEAAATDSIFFAVAKALANGAVTLDAFTPEGLRQADALAIAARTDYVIEPELGSAAIVEVTTWTGDHYSSRVDVPRGDPSKPMTPAQLVEKFADCARYAAHPLSPERVAQVVETIDRLDEVADVALLPALVSGGEGRTRD
jgi:2-methylcitrate dehydratase PrpD